MEMAKNKYMKKNYLKIVKKVEHARSKNNKNWMDLLRLAVRKAPKEARLILKKINKEDKAISKLLSKIK